MTTSVIKPLKYMLTTGVVFYIEFGLLWLFTDYFNIYYLHSAIYAFLITVTIGYLLNQSFVFRDSKRPYIEAYIIFFLICLSSLGLLIGGMYALVNIFNVHYLLARIVMTAFTFIWTYSLNNLVNFKTR